MYRLSETSVDVTRLLEGAEVAEKLKTESDNLIQTLRCHVLNEYQIRRTDRTIEETYPEIVW